MYLKGAMAMTFPRVDALREERAGPGDEKPVQSLVEARGQQALLATRSHQIRQRTAGFRTQGWVCVCVRQTLPHSDPVSAQGYSLPADSSSFTLVFLPPLRGKRPPDLPPPSGSLCSALVLS